MKPEKGKLYKLYGINVAVEMLRPGALWEFDGQKFTRWDDARPCPTPQDVFDVMEKIKNFEDSIDTIYTAEQLAKFNEDEQNFLKATEKVEV